MRTPRLRGFTLVEVTVVLALVGIMAGLGIPALRSFTGSMRVTSATNDVFAALLLARSEAVKLRARVALCPSQDGATCAAVHWDRGWIVFHDVNNNGSRDAAEPVVSRWQALTTQLRVSGNANVANYVSYTSLGNTRMASGAFQSGTLTFCQLSAQPTQAREIVLSADGRPRVQKRTVASCA